MSDIFPAPAFDGCDLDIEIAAIDDVIRLALLWEMGMTTEEARCWLNLRGVQPS